MSRGAVHNALGRGQLSSALSRAVGDTAGSSGLERYGETLTPTLDLWEQPEWAYLRREVRLASIGQVGAVVAEYGGAAVVNPVGSGLLLVVEHAAVQATGAIRFHLSRSEAATVLATYAALARGLATDSRWNIGQGAANTAGASVVAFGTDPAQFFGGAIDDELNVANQFAVFRNLPVVLHPGMALLIECGTANLAINTSFAWRERLAFPGELE